MSTNDPLFGVHAAALQLQRRRMELIASNIANADTPGFQARDLDFRQLLATAQADSAGADHLARTQASHLNVNGATPEDPATVYRVPMQPAADGNTVDVQIEQAQYADAALRYQAGLSFLDGRIKSLITALTGS